MVNLSLTELKLIPKIRGIKAMKECLNINY